MTATEQRGATSPPGALAIGRRRIGVEFKQFFRDRDSAIWNFSLPVLLMVIFGSVFGGQTLSPDIDISFAQYFVAGMIASGVVYTSFQNLAIAIPQEREDGTLKRLRGTPMPAAAYFIGKIATVFLVYVVQVAILIPAAVVDAAVRVPVPAEVADAGDAQRVPARHRRGAGGHRFLGAGSGGTRPGRLVCPVVRPRAGVLPVAGRRVSVADRGPTSSPVVVTGPYAAGA